MVPKLSRHALGRCIVSENFGDCIAGSESGERKQIPVHELACFL